MYEQQLEKEIKKIIEFHYGQNLWTFHPELDYEESMASFVRMLAGLAKDWTRMVPPYGYARKIEAQKSSARRVPVAV